MSSFRLLCLFSSAPLRDASFLGRQEGAGWSTEIDQGRCELVALLVDRDMPTLATSGLFAAATLVCRREDLSPDLGAALQAGAASFARSGLSLELVPAEGPVSVIGWLTAHAPELVPLCRPDGEVRTDSPTWWRDRARRHLSQANGSTAKLSAPEPEDLSPELREFLSKRGW